MMACAELLEANMQECNIIWPSFKTTICREDSLEQVKGTHQGIYQPAIATAKAKAQKEACPYSSAIGKTLGGIVNSWDF